MGHLFLFQDRDAFAIPSKELEEQPSDLFCRWALEVYEPYNKGNKYMLPILPCTCSFRQLIL